MYAVINVILGCTLAAVSIISHLSYAAVNLYVRFSGILSE
jgi:hypothetical protein